MGPRDGGAGRRRGQPRGPMDPDPDMPKGSSTQNWFGQASSFYPDHADKMGGLFGGNTFSNILVLEWGLAIHFI